MDSWKRLDETLLPDKNAFYSELHLEDITDKDYDHAQKAWEVFEIKNLVEYHDLYIQSNTLFLADVFENFRDRGIEIYELDPAHFVASTGITMASLPKKEKNKTRIINRY